MVRHDRPYGLFSLSNQSFLWILSLFQSSNVSYNSEENLMTEDGRKMSSITFVVYYFLVMCYLYTNNIQYHQNDVQIFYINQYTQWFVHNMKRTLSLTLYCLITQRRVDCALQKNLAIKTYPHFAILNISLQYITFDFNNII